MRFGVETFRIDWGMLALCFLPPLIGLFILFSAGFNPDSTGTTLPLIGTTVRSPTFIRQGMFFLVGILVFWIGVLTPTRVLKRLAPYFYFGALALVVLVLFKGNVVNGARRWLTFAGFNLQPGELMKLGVVIFLARYVANRPPEARGYTLWQLFVPSIITFAPMVVIAKQPDLGTGLVVAGIGACMLLFAGIRRWVLISIVVATLVSAVPVWKHLHDYQKKRILTLVDPEFDPKGSGYHIMQSKIAVGSGELFGKGYMKGTQTQLEFLPEHTTDFVFSVVAEELGFIGSISIISIFLIFLLRLLLVVYRSRDMFSTLVCFGVFSWIGIHVVVNLGMVVGLLPVVGIPLVMVSYGGSSLLANMFALGCVVGTTRSKRSF